MRTDHNPIIDIGGDKNRMNKMSQVKIKITPHTKELRVRVDEEDLGFVRSVNR